MGEPELHDKAQAFEHRLNRLVAAVPPVPNPTLLVKLLQARTQRRLLVAPVDPADPDDPERTVVPVLLDIESRRERVLLRLRGARLLRLGRQRPAHRE